MIPEEHLYIDDARRNLHIWWYQEKNIYTLRYQKIIYTSMIPDEHLHIDDTRRTFTHWWYQKNN